jgi:cysteine desulfurase family protein
MRLIYLDNAATSFPKAPGVAQAMAQYITDVGGNPGRGGYTPSTQAEITMLTLRERLCAFFGSPDTDACVFTSGATAGLNLVLKGFLKAGDHVVVSSMEHNAVMRPLNQIAGVTVDKAPCAPDGSLDVSALAALIRPETRLVCLTHASNVCGTLLPVAEVGALCRERGVAFAVDAAQTAGHIPISLVDYNADALVVPAHKGMLGPQGVGAILMRRNFARCLEPLIAGGTSSHSDSEFQPAELPDKFEAGTQNLPGIYGFLAALDYLEPNMARLAVQTQLLCGELLNGLARLPHAKILGKHSMSGRVPVVAVDFYGLDNAIVADLLSREFGIAVRCGLHCAPSAHCTLGTFPQGAVRFSIGAFNTADDVRETLVALGSIVTDRRVFAAR